MADITNTYKDAAQLPQSAEECGMEEAYDMGYLQGPCEDLPYNPQRPTEYEGRTDFTSSPS